MGGGFYTIVNARSGLALNVVGAGTGNSVLPEQQTNDPRLGEQWRFQKT